ncbi:MAG: M48 family metalloprotease [Candidatus Methylomirabilales bacterium]
MASARQGEKESGCLRSGQVDRRRFLRGLLLLGGGIAWGLFRGVSPVCAFTVISEAKEEAIGKRAHQEILNKFGYYKDEALQAYVTRVGRRVLREAEPNPFKFQFTVVDQPVINAFAVPGGFVYVTRGILAQLNSEAELATVLGHEIAHVTSHHSAEQLTRALGAQILTLGLAAVSPGGRQNAAGWLALSSELFTQILLGYGREAELEADEKGLRSAVKAGYDPRGMVNFMRALQIQNRLSGVGYHALRGTHPDTLERIDRARVMVGILTPEAKRSLAVKADEYKAHLDGLVYGKRRERKRVRIVTARGGENLKQVAQSLWGTENRAWDLALLNGIRDESRPLHAGQKLKVIYDPLDEPPLRLPKDLSRAMP